MKKIKSFLKTCDLFGITFTFRYKTKEKYQTSLGGIFNLLFLILVLSLGIYYFIPFCNRKNYSIVYYTMNLASTENINFKESKSNFAIGLTCEGNSKEKKAFTDLLKLEMRYSQYIKSLNGSFIRKRQFLQGHNCTYADFYNKYDKQFDYLGLQKYICINNNDYSIEGVYADQIFSYFDFSVTAIDNTTEILDELDRFLFQNDCKFNLVYTDIIIDLNNYKEPVKQFLNNIFIQLNPILLVKRNMFFMNQYFLNDNYLIWIFNDEKDQSERKSLYSRYEEYYLYKGFNRSQTLVDDYLAYARIFMRSDLRRTEIKRKYQKLMEFYADASSMLIALYEILFIIFGFIDNFYSYHSLAKRIFFFKELEDNNFHIFEKNNKIKELISTTSSFSEKKEEVKINNDNNLDNDDIKIYKNIKLNKDNLIINKQSNSQLMPIQEEKNDLEKNKNVIIIKKKKKIIKRLKNSQNMIQHDSQSSFKNSHIKLESFKNNTNNIVANIKFNESNNSEEKISVQKPIKYSFNIIEIIMSQIFFCCISKKLKLKSDLNQKADDILYRKMDIILYIRNMLLFDIMNKTILDNNKKTIINFLCRPIITNDKKVEDDFEEFYKNYKEKDFDKLSEKLPELCDKSQKENRENRLISLSNEHLKDLV